MKRRLQIIAGLLFFLFAIATVFVVPLLADLFILDSTQQWLALGILLVCLEIVFSLSLSFFLTMPFEEMRSYLRNRAKKGALPDMLPMKMPEELKDLYGAFRENIADLNNRIKKLESLSGSDEVRYLLITTISHRLRTPLTGLRWAINELVDRGVFSNDKDKKLINGIAISAQRINEIVETLLTAAETQSHYGVNMREQIDMNLVLNNIIKETEFLAHSKACKVVLESADKKIPTIEGDQQQIYLAIQNVVSNAIYYSNEGQTILINVSRKGSILEIRIIDHGMGISAEEKMMLFEFFQRGRRSFKMNTEGTGLGLYLTKGIIANHKGEITLTDTQGGGTTVIITLPIRGAGELETFIEHS